MLSEDRATNFREGCIAIFLVDPLKSTFFTMTRGILPWVNCPIFCTHIASFPFKRATKCTHCTWNPRDIWVRWKCGCQKSTAAIIPTV